jgi:hypothetical protein
MKRRNFIQLSSKSTIALSTLPFFNGFPFISLGSPQTKINTIQLDEMKGWDIIVSADSIPSEKYAVEEFQRLFKAITSIELKIETIKSDKSSIYIGKSALNQPHSLNSAISTLGEEGLHIHIDKDKLLIEGGRQRGTLYGVYEFFERYLGIRFLTGDHTFIPQNASEVSIPLVNFIYVPQFFFRWSYYKENFDNLSFATQLRINTITDDPRLGGKTSQELITHSILAYLPVSVYGKDHPEYFALVDGIRKLNVAGGPQVCSTNPEVIRIVTEGVNRVLDANPLLKSISVSQMDNDSVCECPICSDLNVKEESLGAAQLALVNAVAEKIAITNPGVKIGTLAYRYSRKPPKSIKLLSNVEIMLCSFKCCTLHPLNDPNCSRNKLFCEDFCKWKEICQNILIWNYNTNFSAYDLPFPNFNVIAKNVQLFQNNNAQGVFMQAAGNGLSAEMSDLRNYVMSRCLWHPIEESWQLVDEFCHLHYGNSAKPILSYLHFLHQNAEECSVHPGCFPKPIEVGLNQRVSKHIYSYFQEALKLAPDQTIRLRVEKATIPALKAILATAPIIYKQGFYKYDANIIGEKVLNHYKYLVQKFSMKRVGEEKLTSVYIDELHALKKGLPAIILENNIWRVLLLPEQKGRVAEMFHKPTGSKLVNEPEAEEAGITSSKKIKSTWQHYGNTVLVTMVSEDGSIWNRRISLPKDKEEIRIQAEYTAGIDNPEWEIHERPCMFRISGSEDPEVVSVCTKDLVWSQGNLDWQFNRGIVVKQLLQAGRSCTSFAFYDHSKHFGMQQNFEANTFQRFFLYWYSGRKEMGMEMHMPVKTIQKGQKRSFSYGINFLETPPWNDGITNKVIKSMK